MMKTLINEYPNVIVFTYVTIGIFTAIKQFCIWSKDSKDDSYMFFSMIVGIVWPLTLTISFIKRVIVKKWD